MNSRFEIVAGELHAELGVGSAMTCVMAGGGGLVAVPVGGGRARAGLEIDHSEPQARVWRSRGRADAHRHIQRAGLAKWALRQASGQAPQVWRAPEGPEG